MSRHEVLTTGPRETYSRLYDGKDADGHTYRTIREQGRHTPLSEDGRVLLAELTGQTIKGPVSLYIVAEEGKTPVAVFRIRKKGRR